MDAINRPNVVQGIDGRRQATVKAEDLTPTKSGEWRLYIKERAHLIINEGRQGEVVEEVGEVLPHVGIAVLSQAFIVEAVHLRDLSALMVSTKDRDTIAVADF